MPPGTRRLASCRLEPPRPMVAHTVITRSRPVIASAFALRSRATALHDLGLERVAAGSFCAPISAVVGSFQSVRRLSRLLGTQSFPLASPAVGVDIFICANVLLRPFSQFQAQKMGAAAHGA